MYILAILAVIASILVMAAVNSGMGLMTVFSFFDISSFILPLIITIPILCSTGLQKSFRGSFQLALGKERAKSISELKLAKDAVGVVQKTLIYSGVFISLFSVILLLREIDNLSMLGVRISMSIQSILYPVALCILLIPIHTKLEIKIAEYMQE